MTTLKRLEKGDTVVFKNEQGKEYEVISVRKSSAVVSGWSVSIRPTNNKKGLIDKGWDQGWFVKVEPDKKTYTQEEVMDWYKYVKTHTVSEAFDYINSKKK